MHTTNQEILGSSMRLNAFYFNDSITICNSLATSRLLLIKSFYSSLKPTARELLERTFRKSSFAVADFKGAMCYNCLVFTINVRIYNELNGSYSISTTITSFLVGKRKVVVIITRIVITITCRKREQLLTI